MNDDPLNKKNTDHQSKMELLGDEIERNCILI